MLKKIRLIIAVVIGFLCLGIFYKPNYYMLKSLFDIIKHKI